jgi:PAS domain S-box-containing protein
MTPGTIPETAADAARAPGTDLVELVRGLDAVVWEMDAESGRFTFVSDRAEPLLGYPTARWLEEPGFWGGVLLHPDDRDEAARSRAAAVGEGRDHVLRYRARAADGRVAWLEERVRVVAGEGGAARLLRGVTVDVTREKEAEARRVDMSQILERITDAFFALDREWRFTYVNRQAERLLARAPEELVGRVVWDEFPEAVGSTFWERYHHAMATGEPVQFQEFFPPLGRWFEVNAYPGAEGLSVYFRDVTEARRAREELERSEAHLRLAVEAGRMGSWEWDIQADRVHWSPQEERLYGLAEGTFEGTPDAYARRIHPDDRAASWQKVRDALAARAPTHHVLHRIVRPDGQVRWLDSHGRFLYAEDGTPLRLAGVSTDVTERLEAEASLRRSEERFRALVDGTDQYIWTNSAEGEMTGEQPAWARLTGQTPEEYRGYGWAAALHPDDREHTVARWRHAVETRGLFEVEHRVRRADGEYGHFWVRGIPLLEPDGTVREWVGVHTDVTPLKAAEEAIREEAQLVETLQRIGAVVAAELDLDRIVQTVTDEATRLTGAQFGAFFYNVVNAKGEAYTLYTISGVPREAFSRFPMPRNTHVFAPTFHGEGVVRSDDITKDPRYGKNAPHHGMPEGHLPVTSYLAVPVRSHGGEVVGGLFFGHERPGVFTARHEQLAEGIAGWAALAMDNARLFQAQESARAAAEHARTELLRIFEQAPAAISVTHGPDHVTATQNAMARQIAGGRDMVGKRTVEVFPEIADQGFIELQDRVYATGEPYVGREVLVRFDRDGDGALEEAWLNFVYQPLVDAEGRVYGILTHAVEVTDQVLARREIERKAEELLRLTHALEESNRELDQFAYVTSHDLKAPLRGIASLAQFVEEDLGEKIDGDSREHLALLKGRVHRMGALIDGILEYSRAGRVRARAEPLDAGALVDDVVELLAPPAGVVRVAEGMPTVTAERVPLQQVFLNLVSNALKHGGADAPRVDVGWRDAGGAWEFSVSDNGPGIAPEYHERIWGIFQTLQPRDRVEGTGIGLSVVKKIVETRGGTVAVESAPGRGATFRFTLPKEPGAVR